MRLYKDYAKIYNKLKISKFMGIHYDLLMSNIVAETFKQFYTGTGENLQSHMERIVEEAYMVYLPCESQDLPSLLGLTRSTFDVMTLEFFGVGMNRGYGIMTDEVVTAFQGPEVLIIGERIGQNRVLLTSVKADYELDSVKFQAITHGLVPL